VPIPARDEERTIGQVVADFAQALPEARTYDMKRPAYLAIPAIADEC
jgi:hypothetical protein